MDGEGGESSWGRRDVLMWGRVGLENGGGGGILGSGWFPRFGGLGAAGWGYLRGPFFFPFCLTTNTGVILRAF